MAIILDADVIIRGERGTFDLRAWLTSHSQDQFAIAAVTMAELWHGVERAKPPHRAMREKYLQTVISSLPVIPYTEQIAYAHAKIWADLESSGKLIGFYDLIVAATAIEWGASVATFNKRHFSQVTGLTVVEPK